MKLKMLAFITILLLTFSAQAENHDPSPSCSKPNKPYEFNSQSELDSFNNAVQQYQRCLYDFVDEQEEAIQRHQRAANDAIGEWNNFVRMELN
jgi:TATA-binding protein-associated factor Taf7